MGSPELSTEPHTFHGGEPSCQHLLSWDLPLPLLWSLTLGYSFLATLWSPHWSLVVAPNYGSLVLVIPLGDVPVLVIRLSDELGRRSVTLDFWSHHLLSVLLW